MKEMKSEIDNVVPPSKWEFNEDVTKCFENMLSRSIPQYDVMRKAVFDLVGYSLAGKDSFSMLDIGCSDGLALEPFVKAYGLDGYYVGVDVSEPMLTKAREKFKKEIDCGTVDIRNCDLRNEFPIPYGVEKEYDVILSVLTIMFTPIQYRQKIIQNIYDNLNEGGICIIVEKVLGNSAHIDDMMVDTYYDMKRDNGYTEEQIERKRLSLEGVQVPVTSAWNIDMLKQAGFREIDVFWRWMNFVGYIALK